MHVFRPPKLSCCNIVVTLQIGAPTPQWTNLQKRSWGGLLWHKFITKFCENLSNIKGQQPKNNVLSASCTRILSFKHSLYVFSCTLYPTRCSVAPFICSCETLYMFQAVPPPIIRSWKTVYTASGTLSNLFCYLPLSWKRCNAVLSLPRQWQVTVKLWQRTRCCI